jgi:O-antigen ligase
MLHDHSSHASDTASYRTLLGGPGPASKVIFFGSNEEAFRSTLELVLVFLTAFVGDYAYKEVFMMPFFWLLLCCYRLPAGVALTSVVTSGVVGLSMASILLRPECYSPAYYLGTWGCIMMIPACRTLRDILRRWKHTSESTRLIFLIGFSFVTLLLAIAIGLTPARYGRKSLVFGPNVFYRILGCMFILLLLLNKYCRPELENFAQTLLRRLILIAALCCLSFMLFQTGSRGGVVTFFICSVLGLWMARWDLYRIFISPKGIATVMAAILITCMIAILISTAAPQLILSASEGFNESRALKFYDPAGSKSLATRASFAASLPSFLFSKNFLLGEGSRFHHSYPHNIFLDLLYNGGLIPFFSFVSALLMSIIICARRGTDRELKDLLMFVIPMLFGSLVSGTMFDNYSLTALTFYIPCAHFFSRRQVHTECHTWG